MPNTRVHIWLPEGNLDRLDSLAERWGLSRSSTVTFLVNRAFLEEHITKENTTK